MSGSAPQDDGQDNRNPAPASVATHSQIIGIIHPPSDISTIVDKTASFVAKNGPEFEKRIIVRYAGNPNFNFLNGSDPYHAYYQHQLTKFRAQNLAPEQQVSQSSDAPDAESTLSAVGNDVTEKTDPSAKFRPVKKVLDPPEAEHYTIWPPEGVTGEELDIIKLTAQFVARNGKSFLTGLTSRENNNLQFHFLKPTHSMFMLFTSLADAYSAVLMPPKGLIEKLKKSVTDTATVLDRCLHRLEWEWSQEQLRQKAEDEMEQERLSMSKIDWHDFVVVETIYFEDHEYDDLPPPVTSEEVIRRSKMAAVVEEEVVEPGKEVEMEMDEEEVQLVQEGMQSATLEKNNKVEMIKEENEPQIRIMNNYKRPEERLAAVTQAADAVVISPITGDLIPVNEMSEHMRISLIDPKYKEQKERMFAKIRETALAQDDEISRNLVRLACTLPKIFGTTEEEVSNAVKAEIEKKYNEQPQQVVWDGHTGSIGPTTTQATQNAAEEQIHDGWNLPAPAAPLPRPGVLSLQSLPPPPRLALNLPRVPPKTQYPTVTLPPPRPGTINMMVTPQRTLPQPQPMQMNYSQQQQAYMMNRQIGGQSMTVNPLMPPTPGCQFTPLAPHPFTGMPMVVHPPPMHGKEAAPRPLPEEPEPKKQKLDDSLLVPEDEFLCQHPGAARIRVAVPNTDEGKLKGQILEICVDSLAESIGSLKEKIAGEIELPASKQKLSGKAGFSKTICLLRITTLVEARCFVCLYENVVVGRGSVKMSKNSREAVKHLEKLPGVSFGFWL